MKTKPRRSKKAKVKPQPVVVLSETTSRAYWDLIFAIKAWSEAQGLHGCSLQANLKSV